jgi:hypothetical protein
MGVTDLCRGGVSQLNGGGYNPRGGRRHHIHSPEGAYLINQNYKKKAKQWPNNMSFRLSHRN